MCCQIAVARVANILLCLRSPQNYFGVPHNSFLHLLNVASTATQAHAAFFKPLRALIVDSPWFADKFESGEPPGEMASSIRFIKHIELVSGHSDADNLEGKNLVAGIADEISAFPTLATAKGGTTPAKTAEGLVNMLRSSATTRFELTYKLAQISFPRRKGDAIEQALADAKQSIEKFGDLSTKYASGPLATWDVNPRFNKYERIAMPGSYFGTIPNVASYREQYETDPVEARAKYECAPEKSTNPYFKDKAAIYSAFSRHVDAPPLKVRYFFGADFSAGETRDGWQVDFELHGLSPIPGAIYTIHADMAVTGDRAGIAMSHVRGYREVVTGDIDGESREEMRPEVTVDFATAFEADVSAVTDSGIAVPREIQIRWFRKLVTFLNDRGFVFGSLSMDGFQSVDSLQILSARGFEAQKISVDRTDDCWKSLRDVMYDGRLFGYEHPLLIGELEALTRVGGTGKVDHPSDGSKDLADALAASVATAVQCGGQEETGENTTWGNEQLADLFSIQVRDNGFSEEVAAFGSGDIEEFGAFGRTGDLSW